MLKVYCQNFTSDLFYICKYFKDFYANEIESSSKSIGRGMSQEGTDSSEHMLSVLKATFPCMSNIL